jgi:hypothetical protein
VAVLSSHQVPVQTQVSPYGIVVDRVTLGQVFVHKHDKKIPLPETEVSTPLASNNNFDILSAVLSS